MDKLFDIFDLWSSYLWNENVAFKNERDVYTVVWIWNVLPKAYSPVCCDEEVVEKLKVGYSGWFRSLGVCPPRGLWDPGHFLFSLFTSCHETSSLFHHTLPPWWTCCLTTGPKARQPTNHALKPPKLWAKINLFSFKADYPRCFVTVMES
jgi:hypothetical protein